MSQEPIIAWRKWRVKPGDGLLRSLFMDNVWVPQQRFEARCQRGAGRIVTVGRTCSEAPQRGCRCGVNAVKKREDLVKFGQSMRGTYSLGERGESATPTLIVVGLVSLWGRWVEHEDGWRAQYAYPYELHVVAPAFPRQREGWEIGRSTAALLQEQYVVDAGVM